MIALDDILGTIDPETIDRHSFVRVMQLRDFRRLSPDLIKQLTFRAEREFGRLSLNKPVFELPAWEKKIHVYFQTHRSSQQSTLERNMTAMAKVRYFQWMKEYESVDSKQKAALMNEVVADMRYWQELYFDYLRYLGQPLPTAAVLLQEFQRMIEDFKIGVSPEEIILIDSFAQRMSQALFTAEVQKIRRSILNLFQ